MEYLMGLAVLGYVISKIVKWCYACIMVPTYAKRRKEMENK